MSGTLVYLAGPSGAGKDSLMAWLATHWPHAPGWPALHLAARVVTRCAAAHGSALDLLQESVDEVGFAALLAQGLLDMHWQANGLHYGIRTSELAPLSKGACVLVNGSRAHVPQALRQHPGLCVLSVTAPADLLAVRLWARQRENRAAVQARLERNATVAEVTHPRSVVVCNSGVLADAGAQALAGLALQLGLGLPLGLPPVPGLS